jgi:hypothetical protein
MNKNTITQLTISFDALQQTVSNSDVEFWYARDLQELLGYTEWRNFLKVIDKAKDACRTAGSASDNHFVDVNKMVHSPSRNLSQRELRAQMEVSAKHGDVILNVAMLSAVTA